MCVDFVSFSVKDQRASFYFVRNFGDIQHKADKFNRFSINFFIFMFFYNGDSFNRFTSGKRIFSKVQHFLISYLTSRSPAQTKGLDCLCYCEPRTLKQAALSIMGTCVTYFYQHTYNGDLFNRFTSGVILSYVWGWQTRQWVGLRQILLFWCSNLNHRKKPTLKQAALSSSWIDMMGIH